MAAATQLMPSSARSSFSPYSATASPSTPLSPPPSTSTQHQEPNRNSDPPIEPALLPPQSPFGTDPSPVDSNVTEIEDEPTSPAEKDADGQSEADGGYAASASSGFTSPDSAHDPIDTDIPRPDSQEEGPQSVVYAPSGFKQFDEKSTSTTQPTKSTPSPTPTGRSDRTVVSPVTPQSQDLPFAKNLESKPETKQDPKKQEQSASTVPINTSVTPLVADRATPRAATREELEEEWKRRSRASSSLEDIAEDETDRAETSDEKNDEAEGQGGAWTLEQLNAANASVVALESTLTECWTLCNSLANLSSSHRQMIFSFSGYGEVQEQAWQSCWRLCQNLYESRDKDHATQVKPTLELCREFCQALFEVRHKTDEASDSVLRVSFELNNHLYNTHDRMLPEAFTERTLEFYLALCHRLMKQRTSLPEETDWLLRACWQLAEILFNLRQNKRDGKRADEELLSNAVQACWDLCDLFREGWTQVRPDRGTPRPTQMSFPASVHKAPSVGSRSERSAAMSSGSAFRMPKAPPPETPTTIFDDSGDTSADEDPPQPNILVLGPETSASRRQRWSSTTSSLSGYSEGSTRTSSTTRYEDPHLFNIKILIIKAALNAGYSRNLSQSLPIFIKNLPSDGFGTHLWQQQVLENYRRLVATDRTLSLRGNTLPVKRVSAVEVARAVQYMDKNEQLAWLRDLFKLVFGFYPEESAGKNVAIQT